MGIEIQGVSEVNALLRRTADRTSKRQLVRLRKGVEDVTRKAKEFAPVDDGYLEGAITAVATRLNTFNHRYEFMVGVDKALLGPGKSIYGFDYDVEMHEGVYNLGPLSQQKQQVSGKRVGPKYLARALEEVEAGLIRDMERIVEEETR